MNVLCLAYNGVSSAGYGCALIQAVYRCFLLGAFLAHLLAVPVLVLLTRFVLGRRLRFPRAYLLALIATVGILLPDLVPTGTWWCNGFWWNIVSATRIPWLFFVWGIVFVAGVCVFGVRNKQGECMAFWQAVCMSVPLALFIGGFPVLVVFGLFYGR